MGNRRHEDLRPGGLRGVQSPRRPNGRTVRGTYRARGGELDIIEDDLWAPTRIVVVEFPDIEAARQFLNSEEYAPVAALRHANADCTVVIVEGTD